MMKKLKWMVVVLVLMNAFNVWAQNQNADKVYTLDVGDVLNISVLQPQSLSVTVTVAPDGTINFPYIGMVPAKDKTLGEVQDAIQSKLADGYMKYPVVSVLLQESRSRKFFVYGEVQKPGTYPLDNRTTVLKAISLAGGLTKFGAIDTIKILREKKDEAGYTEIKVNLKQIMKGGSKEDILLGSGDIVVVSQGAF